MKVKFLGEEKRTNSFGTFLPGKTYDVSDKVGKKLLTVPSLFEEVGRKKPKKKADETIVEVPDEKNESGKYDKMNIGALRSLCRKRGIMLTRGVRKADMVAKIEADDEVKGASDITSEDED